MTELVIPVGTYLIGFMCGLATAGLIVGRQACSEERIVRRLIEELRQDERHR